MRNKDLQLNTRITRLTRKRLEQLAEALEIPLSIVIDEAIKEKWDRAVQRKIIVK